MYLVEIGGVKILYTGDYSCEEERYIAPAEVPNVKVDILIVESTYGIKIHEHRDKTAHGFTSFRRQAGKDTCRRQKRRGRFGTAFYQARTAEAAALVS